MKKSIINNSCPVPKLDFDTITLGHGSGGILTNKLLQSGIFDVFDNEYLGQKHDGSQLGDMSRVCFSTDSFVIDPIFFPGGNIGELAVNGTVNDISMCGAKAKFLSLSFIIEEGLKTEELGRIIASIKDAADSAGVHIVTGDTKVVERNKGDKIYINTSGVGEAYANAYIGLNRIESGDKIIVSGSLANHGMAIMSVREGLEFETDIVSDTRHFNHIVEELISNFGEDIHLLKDPTRGGLATVLNEVARDTNTGIDIHQKLIKVEDAVSSACELLGLDPLYVANEGVFIAIVKEDISAKALEVIKQWEFGQDANIIGEIVEEHPKKVVLHSTIGGKRIVNMLVGEQLPRIC